jgi:hypothetical protein
MHPRRAAVELDQATELGARSVMAWELMSDSRIGVRPTMVFFSDTVLEVTNCAYSQAASFSAWT